MGPFITHEHARIAWRALAVRAAGWPLDWSFVSLRGQIFKFGQPTFAPRSKLCAFEQDAGQLHAYTYEAVVDTELL
jgi:hypothetical protein